MYLTANLPRNLPVKKISKSIKIWQNYGHECVAPFFGPPWIGLLTAAMNGALSVLVLPPGVSGHVISMFSRERLSQLRYARTIQSINQSINQSFLYWHMTKRICWHLIQNCNTRKSIGIFIQHADYWPREHCTRLLCKSDVCTTCTAQSRSVRVLSLSRV